MRRYAARVRASNGPARRREAMIARATLRAGWGQRTWRTPAGHDAEAAAALTNMKARTVLQQREKEQEQQEEEAKWAS